MEVICPCVMLDGSSDQILRGKNMVEVQVQNGSPMVANKTIAAGGHQLETVECRSIGIPC